MGPATGKGTVTMDQISREVAQMQAPNVMQGGGAQRFEQNAGAQLKPPQRAPL